MEKAKVFFTEELTADALQKIYRALGVSLPGKVAVKISTGEPGGHNFLQPAMIAPLVKELNGTIVECNTAYEGRRNTTAAHWETMKEHGFMDIAPCDIMDEDGDLSLPVTGGKQLKENFVGAHLDPMGGLGGALKNMSIGIASSRGKQWIHTSGSGETSFDALMNADHNSFLESMADACQAVIAHVGGENIVYINVANRLSVDCDCCAAPAEPEMADIGIFASLDPVAVDQACIDAVYASPDPGKAALIERMESRNGIHTIETAAELGLGTREYEIIHI